MRRVAVSIKFYYDPETYLFDWDDTEPTDEEILLRCKEYFLEDITSYTDPVPIEVLKAEFVDYHSYTAQDTFGCTICGENPEGHE